MGRRLPCNNEFMISRLPAGDFIVWLRKMEAALEGAESEVPCGDCTACCRSSHFVHVGPNETDALAHIPAGLLFPAPGATDGTLIMGYNEQGHCPMLVDSGCSIHTHRPQACRVYDCRVFAATGVESDKPAVAERVRRWVFNGETSERESVRSAVEFLAKHADKLPEEAGPYDATRTAAAAIRIHRLFATEEPSFDEVARELRR